jgi:hypothetical protein
MTDALQKQAVNIYRSMLYRCKNSKSSMYYLYGARGIKVTISREDFYKIWIASNKCQVCGVKFDPPGYVSRTSRSVDRIDNNGDYSLDNTQVICNSCNASKRRGTRKERQQLESQNKILLERIKRVNKLLGNINHEAACVPQKPAEDVFYDIQLWSFEAIEIFRGNK